MYINHSVWLSFQYMLAVIIGLFGSKTCLRLNLILMDLVTSLIKKKFPLLSNCLSIEKTQMNYSWVDN